MQQLTFKTYFDAAGDDGTFLPYGHDGLLYYCRSENNTHLNVSCKNDGKLYLISNEKEEKKLE
jgi:hypothetical protein